MQQKAECYLVDPYTTLQSRQNRTMLPINSSTYAISAIIKLIIYIALHLSSYAISQQRIVDVDRWNLIRLWSKQKTQITKS